MSDENCALLDYYAVSSRSFLQTLRTTYRYHLQEPRIKKECEYGTDMLSRNVGKKLPLLAA